MTTLPHWFWWVAGFCEVTLPWRVVVYRRWRRQERHQRCLANIDRLEREVGMVPAT